MAVWPRWVGALLAGALATGVAAADDPVRESWSPKERVAKEVGDSSSKPPDEKPIADSIDAAVDEFIRVRTPCALAGEGVPCFPIAIKREAPVYSVKDSLQDMQGDGPPAPPTAPTHGEIIQAGANPSPVAANVGGGGDVSCKAKQLLRKILGKSKTYYVYRVWNSTGVRGILREKPLDPAEFASVPEFQYELVGRFGDDCEALKAYRKVGHDARVQGAVAAPDSISTSPP